MNDDPTDHETDPTAPSPGSEWVEVRPEAPRRRRFLLVVAVLAGCALVVFGVGGGWLYTQLNPSGSRDPIEVTVAEGSTTAQIARQLESEGVVSNATVFEYYVRWKGAGPFEAGVYDNLTTNASMASVVGRLEAGPLPPKYTELAVIPGFWQADVRSRILDTFPQMDPGELDAALASVRSAYQPTDVQTLEGLLFPATYRVEEGDQLDEQLLVRQMVEKFDEVGKEIGLDQASTKLAGVAGSHVVTPYEAVIVASMVEAEAKVPEDKPKIARVIYNRLAQGIPLGIDATVVYATGKHTQQVTSSDLKIDSPYNTRKYPGLPPTPIGSPGRDSLEAALAPAQGDWLYYVLADEAGHHYFTNNYQDFLRAQDEARSKGLL